MSPLRAEDHEFVTDLPDIAEGSFEEIAETADEVVEATADTPQEKERRGRRRRRRGGKRRRDAAVDLEAAPSHREELDEIDEAAETIRLEEDDEDAGSSSEEAAELVDDQGRPKRRRRRRRRRGGRNEPREEDAAAEHEADRFEEPQRARSLPLEPRDIDGEDLESDGQAEHDLEHEDEDRTKHRSIPSWEEVIGTIVNCNMEARAKRPATSSGTPRGRGGRGRGDRGRGRR